MAEKIWLFRIRGNDRLRYIPIEVSRVPCVGEHVAWAAGTEVDAGVFGSDATTTSEPHYRVIKVIHLAGPNMDPHREHVAEVFAVEDTAQPH
jgi:hypothetical protein